jgi:hypothetical protein
VKETVPVSSPQPDLSSPFALEVLLRGTRVEAREYRLSWVRWVAPTLVVEVKS